MRECIPGSDCFDGGCCCGMGLETPDFKHKKPLNDIPERLKLPAG